MIAVQLLDLSGAANMVQQEVGGYAPKLALITAVIGVVGLGLRWLCHFIAGCCKPSGMCSPREKASGVHGTQAAYRSMNHGIGRHGHIGAYYTSSHRAGVARSHEAAMRRGISPHGAHVSLRRRLGKPKRSRRQRDLGMRDVTRASAGASGLGGIRF